MDNKVDKLKSLLHQLQSEKKSPVLIASVRQALEVALKAQSPE